MATKKAVSKTVVDRNVLVRGLMAAKTSAASDGYRPILSSVLIERTVGGLRLTGADNYRIAERTIPLPTETPVAPWAIAISYDDVKRMIALLKMAPKREPLVTLDLSQPDGMLLLEVPSARVTGSFRAVDGKYPDTAAVFERRAEEKSMSVSFTPSLMAGLMASFDDVVKLTLQGPRRPILFHQQDGKKRGALMPVRVAEDDVPVEAP